MLRPGLTRGENDKPSHSPHTYYLREIGLLQPATKRPNTDEREHFDPVGSGIQGADSTATAIRAQCVLDVIMDFIELKSTA